MEGRSPSAAASFCGSGTIGGDYPGIQTLSKQRTATLAKKVGAFLRQYTRQSQKRQEPNDRTYDRKMESVLKRLRPEDLDIINDKLEDD